MPMYIFLQQGIGELKTDLQRQVVKVQSILFN